MSKGLSRRYKALLLSAFVFPGAGHLSLKRYGRGAGVMAIALAGVTVIISTWMTTAMAIVEKLQAGDAPVDADALSQLLDHAYQGHDGLIVDIAGYAVLFCWLFGMIDSYRLGKRQDALDAQPSGGEE